LRELVMPPVPAIAFQTGILQGPDSVRMSPVHVQDVASAFVGALANAALHGRTIALGGPEALSWRVMIERIAATVGRRKLFLPMPIPLMRPVAAALGRFAWFPVTTDQLAMLAEGNTADPAPLAGLLGRAPLPFDTGSLAYLRAPRPCAG
jgi:NADH dehydrogenase